MRQGKSADGEMLGNHAQILVPVLVVTDGLLVESLEGKGRYVVC